MGETELAEEVHNVIANLQNLVKHGLIKADDGYNGFLVDIQQELVARTRRRADQIKEIERLNTTINELNEQEADLKTKIKDLEEYINGVRKKLRENFKPITKAFSWKQMTEKKLNIVYSHDIPTEILSKLKFTVEQKDPETFSIKGAVKGLPTGKREFALELGALLEAKEDGEQSFDTKQQIHLNVVNTILFLNKNFYAKK